MAKKLANDYLLWLDGVTTGTYSAIKGQGNLSVSRSTSKIDLSTKDDLGYGSSAPGIRDLGIELDLIPNLPDTTGYTRLETLCNANPVAPFLIQIRKGGSSGVMPGDVVFAGLVYGSLDSTAYNQNSGVAVKVSFYPASAPTTDLLA